MWGLTIALSALSYGAAGFLLEIFDVASPGRWLTTAVALLIITAGTFINMVGRSVLKVMVVASIIAEVIGSVGLGTVLLLFYRVNPVSTLFDGFGTQGDGLWLTGPFLVAIAFVGWSFLGFEAAGSIGEEWRARAQRPEGNYSLPAFVALVVMYSSLALILAIPDPLEGYVYSKRRSGGRHAHRALRRRDRPAVADLVRDRLSFELPCRPGRRVAVSGDRRGIARCPALVSSTGCAGPSGCRSTRSC